MIKFDKVTLEPKFIDPSMCFCGGGDGGGGGGTPTEGTNAINRGTVGMSVADMNRRAAVSYTHLTLPTIYSV